MTEAEREADTTSIAPDVASTGPLHNPAIAYRREIDGLRAIAVLPVILFHAGIASFSGGFVGVDVFFVISGYLITSIILREIEQGKFSILRFYERRAKRILPALFLVMVCSLLVAWVVALPTELVRFGQGLMAVATFSSNVFFSKTLNYFAPAADLQPLVHTWSLAVEEQYYLLFPLCLVLFVRFGKKALFWITVLAALGSLCISEWGWRNAPNADFYLLPSRAWELLSGSIVAFVPASKAVSLRKKGCFSESLALLGLLLIVLAILDFHASSLFPGLFKLAPVVGAVLIIGFASESGFTGAFLASRPLVGIGLISYSAYLWHYPVFAFVRMGGYWLQSRREIALLVLIVLALAWLSWRFIENYGRKVQLVRSSVFLWSIASLAVLFGIGYSLSASRGFPSRVTSLFQNSPAADREFIQELLQWESGENDNRFCRNAVPVEGLASCEVGVTNKASVDVIVWGDSLAGALAYGMDSQLRERGQKGLFLISSGCPPIWKLSRPSIGGCTARTHQRAMDIIGSVRGAKTVFLLGNLYGGASDSDCLLDGRSPTWAAVRANLAEVSRMLATWGKKLVIVQQGPFLPEVAYRFYLHDRIRKHSDELMVRRVDYEYFIKDLSSLAQVAGYVNTTEFFCGKLNCPATQHGELYIYDEDHYTFAGSIALARFILHASGAN